VQGFVAQARRTRDFWAGSFLLSWLSAVAMAEVEKQGGEVIFPKVGKKYLAWLTTGQGELPAPQQGCIPNRFKGGLAKVPGDFKPKLVEDAIKAAWKGLAEAVWQQDLSRCKQPTREIWNRQIGNFWEISWALTGNEEQSNLLDRRKNWRTYMPPNEPGVKCMMMDGWQELSGTPTPNAEDLAKFWDESKGIRSRSDTLKADLREHEYLCAIAFVKRRFVRCFKGFKVNMANGWTAHGWEVKASVPSVAYMAAAPWLAKVLEKAPQAELQAFHDAAKQLTQSSDEYSTRLKCVEDVLRGRTDRQLLWNIKSLDGNVFFDAALDNKNIYQEQDRAQRVRECLNKLRQKTDVEPVSPFYAVLMMDGDSLGVQMSEVNKQTSISDSLNYFTQGVAEKVREHSGFLIYAGGDDVLALLPLEFALNCANALRLHYEVSFKQHGKGLATSTLSAAIVYAHIKIPLGKVLSDAHRLLDDVAKDQCGRNSIAVRVWKPGGQHLQWAMPWTRAVPNERVVIDSLARYFQQKEQETPFSNKFFFTIDELFGMLQSKSRQGKTAMKFAVKDIVQLIAAEYLTSGVNVNRKPKLTLDEAKKLIGPLVRQCFFIKRIVENGQETFSDPTELNADAMHLVRFLAQKGVEHG
jgi:CRISPR-associated protein Cmr2